MVAKSREMVTKSRKMVAKLREMVAKLREMVAKSMEMVIKSKASTATHSARHSFSSGTSRWRLFPSYNTSPQLLSI
jgi:hypothetical protein